MEEVRRVADRITVLRDGRHVCTVAAHELDERALISAMLGKELVQEHARTARRNPAVVLSAENLTVLDPKGGRPLLDRARFRVCAGEVLGLAGLGGSGAAELLRALFGVVPSTGELRLDGRGYAPANARDAIARGVMYLAADRRSSVFPELSVTENATLSSLARFSRIGWVERAREREAVREWSERLALKAPSLAAPARALSGGNQQKVALVRALLAGPRLLLLDDPTRGVDVAAKADVHALVRELASRGVAVILASSELEELCALSDRVLVLFRGQVTAELVDNELERGRILHAAMGRTAA
jgi:ABC-type sugar transport system ATPase subunit